MSAYEIIFIITALATFGAALMVVTTPNLVHAALWLVVTLFGVAVTFVLLSAAFLAVVQIVIYIGAIAILMIFAIMLTQRVMKASGPQANANWWLAALIGFVFFAGLTVIFLNSEAANLTMPVLEAEADSVGNLGRALLSPNGFVLPFELASVLLLAALIGAIVVAWKE